MEYKFFKRTSFYFMLVCFVIALFYFVCPAKYCLPITYYLICALVLIASTIKFTMLNRDYNSDTNYYLDIAEAFTGAAVGVVAINFGQEHFALSIILGFLYMIPLCVRLVLATIKINQLFLDSFKYMYALVLILANERFTGWSRFVLGAVYLSVGFIILITKLKHLNEFKKGSYFYE